MFDRINKSFEKQSFMKLLGAELKEVEEGYCVIALDKRDDLSQQAGFVHAGVLTSIVDSACGYAALTMMPADKEVVSSEFKVNLLRPAVGSRFEARARVLKAGSRVVVVEGEIIDLDSNKLVLKMLASMMPV